MLPEWSLLIPKETDYIMYDLSLITCSPKKVLLANAKHLGEQSRFHSALSNIPNKWALEAQPPPDWRLLLRKLKSEGESIFSAVVHTKNIYSLHPECTLQTGSEMEPVATSGPSFIFTNSTNIWQHAWNCCAWAPISIAINTHRQASFFWGLSVWRTLSWSYTQSEWKKNILYPCYPSGWTSHLCYCILTAGPPGWPNIYLLIIDTSI